MSGVGPRTLLPFDVVALVLALAGAGVLAPPLVAAYVLGALTGAVVALGLAWRAMTPNFRLLVRASWSARRAVPR